MIPHRRVQEGVEWEYSEEASRGRITSCNNRGMVGEISKVG